MWTHQYQYFMELDSVFITKNNKYIPWLHCHKFTCIKKLTPSKYGKILLESVNTWLNAKKDVFFGQWIYSVFIKLYFYMVSKYRAKF